MRYLVVKIIKTQNFQVSVLVDDEDFERLNQYNWFLTAKGYITRNVKKDNGKWTRSYMHKEILSVPEGFEVEHADQNKANNQKSNLRPATRSQNMANVRRAQKVNAHSKYKGVSFLKKNGYVLKKPWLSYIKVDYKMYYNGYYDTEAEAAHIYNQFAEQIFGEFAYLNVIE
jgi:hypothetical protein